MSAVTPIADKGDYGWNVVCDNEHSRNELLVVVFAVRRWVVN